MEESKHPCYNADAHHKYARMHLPVAPQCNISCNYCNRKFDCVNESRPGVTSEVLTPELASQKFSWVKENIENLSVVGIAGPGDALANWDVTKKSIELIQAKGEDIIFCLSTNGLMLPHYAAELVEMGIKHITVTVNCLDPNIGARLYKVVNYEDKSYTGVAGAELMIQNQLKGIAYLVEHGVLVKINIVMVKGINDHHIPEVVKKMKELGVFITNIMPLIPAPGSAFEKFPQTSMKEINEMRDLCQLEMQQMRHCKQCRADAVGLLGNDRSNEFRMTKPEPEKSVLPAKQIGKEYRIAVTSKHGKLVDQHFGHATEFLIYQINDESFTLVERRKVEQYCSGVSECDSDLQEGRKSAAIQAIEDCDAVLTMRIGYHGQQRLLEHGIVSVEYCYTVEEGLAYAVEQLTMKKAI
ncbi:MULTISPECIES: nitrogenase cofactor biosynthesis protein NifB [Pelosinus]|uniref:FeMo cofactor biosynthesis protein NifB n=1 Tax=Pelosinus fermentans B4 TaxID=1149862 RepID=I9B0I3_9FIRM|nr:MULTISPECIES: nitrogenase cofactor biosynthesis protein NifB [Pelosinus]EIW18657.1 nitrogenase cofactor biosynthesis protein NifB [Pelosinus fermentans B4]EIW25226.1 nitrogenase cofactor biosynthesis protein NifB [Pelosinus fermentans A11]